ncbi:hypothetical protein MMF93_20155 [Streptomyces tubbatahanensis]|uniref:Uncharacterized protein n=1 Tax=Streptomyces tubbatahanensis TaxID=2923272 RepID=A0ABY3XVZ8_9ACTN|nr:hypothetical protein [Streptomyces tubbatahanensis]UNS98510.1 hypothetical protein MMF93_20155 [Streptomyces tubbatahanensis]
MTTTRSNATRYDTWMLKTMNDARTKRYHATRRARRRIVAAHLAATAVAAAGMVTPLAVSSPWPLVALLVAGLVWIPLMGLLNSMTRGLLELRPRVLDERQLAERGTVHALAYRISSSVMAAALLGFYAAWLAGAGLDALAAPLATAGFGLLVLHWLLPHWIAALRVQDEPEDDEPWAAPDPT